MKYYKDPNTDEVFAYENEQERQEWGAPELVEMTPEEVQEHLHPTPTLEELKSRKLLGIDFKRDKSIEAGFECNGIVYDSDQKSIQRISAIATLALMDSNFTTPYITKDNTTVTLDATDIAALGQAAAAHEANYIFLARSLKDQVLAAETKEDLDAIVWPEEV